MVALSKPGKGQGMQKDAHLRAPSYEEEAITYPHSTGEGQGTHVTSELLQMHLVMGS